MKRHRPSPKTDLNGSRQSKFLLSSVHSDMSEMQLQPLTLKEKKVLQFLCDYISQHGCSPTYQEICDHFQLASYNSVQNYIKQLTRKGYVSASIHGKRAILVKHDNLGKSFSHLSKTGSSLNSILQPKSAEVLSLPLLGAVAAGSPLEAYYDHETFSVPAHMVKNVSQTYVLKVKGDSMIDEGIFHNDFLLIENTVTASHGALVVAKVGEEATVKRIYFHESEIELRPSNVLMSSMWYSSTEVEVRGIVVGLIRNYL